MIVFSVVLVIVTGLFMLLGTLLFIYAKKEGIAIPLMDGQAKTDLLFLRYEWKAGVGVAITFILGLIAAAYSSADSALTSLTTSFVLTFYALKRRGKTTKKDRKQVHVGMVFF